MKHLSLIFLFAMAGLCANAQSCKDVSVEISVVVQANPPKITLNWLGNAATTGITLYRKLKADANWGTTLATLPANATQYIDSNIIIGTLYEYRIMRSTASWTGNGYINAAVNARVTESRGRLILLVDSSMVVPLAAEIKRLVQDLEGDGWKVIRHQVLRSATVTSVKALIVADYNQDQANTKAVFLLGHVPVPYSGNINPDGHPDHLGAWPADVYYGDMNGSWTDNSVNNTVASDSRNDNIPGDGKFDQSYIPSDIELQLGRVDFANMPAFAATEQQLLKNYLDKDHNYRHKQFTVLHRAVIDDNFGYFGGEAFAASGWKNFGPLVGPANVSSNDYFITMTGNSYLWSYGCGGGSYTSAGGIGNTTDFAAANLQGIFTMLFGSYFGDWDSQNNFLRAALAQGTTLTNVWSGRPHWQFHHMGLGENIGYDVRISQNNNSLYIASYGARFVHLALMGDPTLRNDIVAPVSNVIATKSDNSCNISWTASTDAVLGYHLYVKSDSIPYYVRVNEALITGTSYTDSCLWHAGIYTYMVRAMVLQTSPSGTYYNLSQGITDTAWNTSIPYVIAAASSSILGDIRTFTNTSANADSYFWDFGDGSNSTLQNPVHAYLPGNYMVTLIAFNSCASDTLILVVAGPQWNTIQGQITYSNAAHTAMYNTNIQLSDTNGFVVASTTTNSNGFYLFEDIPDGTYTLSAQTTLPWGGANSADALLALKHYTNIAILTNIYAKAADVNNTNFINGLDALMISRRFTGNISGFIAGDWYIESLTFNVSGSGIFNQYLKAICYGDCNGSYVPGEQ